MAKAPGVTAVSEVRHADGRIGTKKVMVTGVDPNMSKTIDIAWKDGSDEVPAQLGRNGAFVDDRYAKDHSLHVGSPIALQDAERDARTARDRHLRPAEGRLAVRSRHRLARHVRPLVREPV